jgi:hypothetical protein
MAFAVGLAACAKYPVVSGASSPAPSADARTPSR